MLARFPKKDIAQGGGSIRDWGFTIADVYSTKANVGNGWRCKGVGPVILGFRGAGATGEAGQRRGGGNASPVIGIKGEGAG